MYNIQTPQNIYFHNKWIILFIVGSISERNRKYDVYLHKLVLFFKLFLIFNNLF